MTGDCCLGQPFTAAAEGTYLKQATYLNQAEFPLQVAEWQWLDGAGEPSASGHVWEKMNGGARFVVTLAG